MGRKPIDSEPARWSLPIVLLLGVISCSAVYMFLSVIWRPSKVETLEQLKVGDDENCCNGIDNLELWGSAVKWGSEFKLNSSRECCQACKAMCTGNNGPCLCDSWLFCGNREACGNKFGECWLKKQKDGLVPEQADAGESVMWTSGLVFGKGEGIISFETEHGTLHIKLLPECSPHSVSYVLELMELRHCAGCNLYRAESRGQFWDLRGNHIEDASFGPPFGLIQGTLGAQGMSFNKITGEYCPTLTRGSVAWVGSGPEFFISLANHEEWKNSYTMFGWVLPEDMHIADKIADLLTKMEVWHGIIVSVLEKPVPLKLRRIQTAQGEFDLNAKE